MVIKKHIPDGKAISAYMKERSITQEKFAEMIEVSQAIVSRWINGKEAMTPQRAAKIQHDLKNDLLKHQILPSFFETPVDYCDD